MSTGNLETLKFHASASLDHSRVFTSICCLAQGTRQENESASTWLPVNHQTEACRSILGKEGFPKQSGNESKMKLPCPIY